MILTSKSFSNDAVSLWNTPGQSDLGKMCLGTEGEDVCARTCEGEGEGRERQSASERACEHMHIERLHILYVVWHNVECSHTLTTLYDALCNFSGLLCCWVPWPCRSSVCSDGWCHLVLQI